MRDEFAFSPGMLDSLALAAEMFAASIAPQLLREGGYLFVCDTACRQLLHKKLGNPPPATMAKYREFSREKAIRLLKHPEHVLSWQSRDPEHGRWGGAVRLPSGIIFSFSGFPEMADEAFCASLACIQEWATEKEMLSALRISGNTELFESMVNP